MYERDTASRRHHGARVASFVVALALAFLLFENSTAAAQASPSSPPPREGTFSFSAEALVWWFKDSPAPVPLVTNGILGKPGTTTFLGDADLDTGANPGFRLTASYGLTERWGIEGSFLYIPSRSTSNSVSSPGTPGSTNLVVPFFDATKNAESSTEISYASLYKGSAREELSNSLLGAELNGTFALAPAGPLRVDLLGGFRWLRLHETYTFATSSPFVPPLPQDTWNTKDEFDTFNNFYGAQAGVRARFDWGRFFTTGTVKFAMGAMVQKVAIHSCR